ncbi:hypothetical protein LVJ83_04690 [Uruburuella testudinis]|uniref:Uncharacterized protein n=1 Tax=Uruburuella testudinis TaxID=1282863 RepID=A0ABY4DV97_9NEIS|nr:hypothetical protein [Uruburuella testudinis]UOO82766.1 hypothetical protein LVJ83_04690 [Uruburuella testudinis]
MNKYWEMAFNFDAQVWAVWFALAGFVIGWLHQGWAAGIVYGMIAPFMLIPIAFVFVLMGAVYELIPKKHS